MKIRISTDEMKFILNTLSKACAGKNDARPVLRAIHLEFEENKCTAVALNGYLLAIHVAPCQIDEGEGRMEMNVLPDKLYKFATQRIDLDDSIPGFLQLSSFGAKQMLPVLPETNLYIDWRQVYPPRLDCETDAPRRIAFDPALLKIATDIAGKETIRMKFGRETAAAHCAIGENTRLMLLPVRMTGDAWSY